MQGPEETRLAAQTAWPALAAADEQSLAAVLIACSALQPPKVAELAAAAAAPAAAPAGAAAAAAEATSLEHM